MVAARLEFDHRRLEGVICGEDKRELEFEFFVRAARNAGDSRGPVCEVVRVGEGGDTREVGHLWVGKRVSKIFLGQREQSARVVP